MQACLGISFDPAAHALHFNYPVLPPFLTSLYFNNVTLGGSRVSVLVRRLHEELSVSVVARSGPRDIRVITIT